MCRGHFGEKKLLYALFAPRMRSSFLSFTVTIFFMTLKEFATWPFSFSFPFFFVIFSVTNRLPFIIFTHPSVSPFILVLSIRVIFGRILIAHFVVWVMVDISYLTFAINLILNLKGSKLYIDNVFTLIARIVFKAPTDKFNSAGTNHTFSVKYPILRFIQSISASFWTKKN